jgi:hypothetical protein
MKIHTEFQQKSDVWLLAKSGIVTASEVDALFTPLFKIKDGEAVETLLNVKLAEWWTGRPLDSISTFAMDNGNILEDEAKPYYEISYNQKVDSVGLVTNEEGECKPTIGCSPDGLIGDDGGLEIKCPNADTHAGYLRSGGVPKKYIAQIHFSLFVTGRAWWDFFSYRRKFPPVKVRVLRDEKIINTISLGVSGFMAELEAGKKLLIEKNGGVPPPPKMSPPPNIRFTTESESEYAKRTGDVSP